VEVESEAEEDLVVVQDEREDSEKTQINHLRALSLGQVTSRCQSASTRRGN
jgi:hypothetical protein